MPKIVIVSISIVHSFWTAIISMYVVFMSEDANPEEIWWSHKTSYSVHQLLADDDLQGKIRPICIYGYRLNYDRKQHTFFFETFSKSIVNESCADATEKNNARLNIIAYMIQNGVDKSEPFSVCQVLFIYLHLVSTSRSISALMLVDFWLSADTPLIFSWITVALLLTWFNFNPRMDK